MVTLSCFHRVSSWQSRFLSTAMLGIASASVLLPASPTLADPARSIVNEKFSDFAPAIAELRQEAGQDRRNIVRANMLLTETESARFWPLYDEYRAERQKIGDRRVRLITDFLAQKNSMSEDNDPQGASLIRVILEGTSAPNHAAATAMPSFGAAYTDAEIAAVANYAITHFGGKQGQVKAKDVADARP
jgi:hypothetical protein